MHYPIPEAGEDKLIKEAIKYLRMAENFNFVIQTAVSNGLDPAPVDQNNRGIAINRARDLLEKQATKPQRDRFRQLQTSRLEAYYKDQNQVALLKSMRESTQTHLDYILNARHKNWRNFRSMDAHSTVSGHLRDIAQYDAEILFLESKIKNTAILTLDWEE